MEILFIVIFIINIFLVSTMVFLERKKPNAIIVWTLVLIAFPVVGFILYGILGNGLSLKTRRMLKEQNIVYEELKSLVKDQKQAITKKELSSNKSAKENEGLILLNIDSLGSVYTENNEIEIFIRGKDKLKSLIKDLKAAKQTINLCYYIYASDSSGDSVSNVLIEKAKQGVTVNLLIDGFGSKRFSRKKFKQLKKAGVNIVEFFPPLKLFRSINLRVNYRNHRKLAIIDGKIAYIGGINIRNDHMEEDGKFVEWRDEHLRIIGDSVFDIQRLFLKDWRYAFAPARDKNYNLEKYFAMNDEVTSNCGVQIIHSGPDDNRQQIKLAMIKMIMSAKKSVSIQSPYFVPDDSFLDAIKAAALSGVEVNIMIPQIPDQTIPYYATLSYCEDLIKYGVNIYARRGFIHAKTIVVDESVSMVGSCNCDIRSFSLNFEAGAVVYDKKFAVEMNNIFNKDVLKSSKLDEEYFNKMKKGRKFLKSFCRLFSGVL